ncbi:MAG: hypothetical protein IKN63_02790 [Bacilli bacterium]|nr:hypothetical protein [Bacilli bacterium]
MWAIFIFLLGLLGLYLINTFGIITTTNQQDYTLIKNEVEAAMQDSLDLASYRAGFYLCIKDSSINENNTPITFNDKKDYSIVLNSDAILNDVNYDEKKCKLVIGEYKLNKEVFVESFIRRYANNINNNKSYQITIQEVIEYPPKVSVKIDTYNTYDSSGSNSLEFSTGDFNISNKIDAILEEK